MRYRLQQVKKEATIKETLRTLPPSSTANRRLTKSVVVNGILYEKGCAVIAEPRLAQFIKKIIFKKSIGILGRFLKNNLVPSLLYTVLILSIPSKSKIQVGFLYLFFVH
ncbi:MAG: hypothetical protein AAF208_14650 [Cyanobacteria bacterium P01_A01_bin.45]